jgi:hypothetical protein
MSRRPTHGTGIASRQRLRRIVLVAGAVLIGSASSVPVPSASATLMGEAANTVGSAVESVAPVAPRAPVKLRPEAVPAPSPPPSSSGVGVPPVDGVAGAAGDSAGSVTSIGRETTQQAAAASVRNAGSPVSIPTNGPDAGAGRATPRPIGTASSAPTSITVAEVAAVKRWIARIWPAIPLGGNAGRALAARAMGDLLRPAAAATARLLSLAPLIARGTDGSPYSGHPGTASASRLALPDVSASADGRGIIYLIVLVALLAFLAFPIWREFRSVLRPWLR